MEDSESKKRWINSENTRIFMISLGDRNELTSGKNDAKKVVM